MNLRNALVSVIVGAMAFSGYAQTPAKPVAPTKKEIKKAAKKSARKAAKKASKQAAKTQKKADLTSAKEMLREAKKDINPKKKS